MGSAVSVSKEGPSYGYGDGSFPKSPNMGDLHYDATTNTMYMYMGESWTAIEDVLGEESKAASRGPIKKMFKEMLESDTLISTLHKLAADAHQDILDRMAFTGVKNPSVEFDRTLKKSISKYYGISIDEFRVYTEAREDFVLKIVVQGMTETDEYKSVRFGLKCPNGTFVVPVPLTWFNNRRSL